ncbi:MAG TPA: DUF2461 domain-containing protein [Bacteroidota bacterium]|mgnify:CR=1 FL=1|nr:DUF2461 domain-containing protein [Bacteroidota bacterium]
MRQFKLPQISEETYPPFTGFPEEGIRFLQRLKRNNRREWFQQHKEEYERVVKLPMQSLIVALQPRMATFAPEFEVNPSKSLFRIYRDVRFSPDKTPYKTHVAAHFVVSGKPKGMSGLGYYLHIEPGECYIGGGLYIPDPDQLKLIRRAIATKWEEFLSIVHDEEFEELFLPLELESTKRVPRGYSDDHPAAEWLKLKQFSIGVTSPHTLSFSPAFVDYVVRVFQAATPWTHFLLKALD